MLRPKLPLIDRQCSLQQRLCFPILTLVHIKACQVVQAVCCVRMLSTKSPLSDPNIMHITEDRCQHHLAFFSRKCSIEATARFITSAHCNTMGELLPIMEPNPALYTSQAYNCKAVVCVTSASCYAGLYAGLSSRCGGVSWCRITTPNVHVKHNSVLAHQSRLHGFRLLWYLLTPA